MKRRLRLAILGAGDHGRVVLNIARLSGRYQPVCFLDDREAAAGSEVAGLPVRGTTADLAALARRGGFDAGVVAIGSAEARLRLAALIEVVGLELATLVHPSALVDPDVTLGRGVVVDARACLTHNPVLGDLVIVNPLVSVNHDNVILEAVHLAAGVALGGNVRIGQRTLVGVGAAVAPGVRIGDDCIIAAGAAVMKNVRDGSVMLGNPARLLRKRGPDAL